MSEPIADALVRWLAVTSWQVTLVALLALAVQRWLGGMLAPRIVCLLWLLVIARLLLPGVPAVRGGVARPAFVERKLGPSAAPDVLRSGAALTRSPGDPRAPAAGIAAERPIIQPVGTATPLSVIDASQASAPLREPAEATARSAPLPARVTWSNTQRVVAVWIAGGVLLLLRWGRIEYLFRRRLCRAVPVTNPAVLEILHRSCVTLGVRRPPRLVTCERIASPAVAGVFRPCLLLPAASLTRFAGEELRHIFLHELAHVRHGDVRHNLLLMLLRCVYWFHPVVHLAVRRLQAGRELLRDANVLTADAAIEPIAYARTLVKLVEGRGLHSRSLPAVGLLDGTHDLKRRILMITDRGRFGRRNLWAAAGIGGIMLWVGFTNASTPNAIAAPPGAADGARGRIHVARQGDPPAWRNELTRKLDQRMVRIDWDEAVLPDALKWIAESGQLNLVTMPAVLDMGDQLLSLHAGPVPIAQALDLVTSLLPHIDWCLHRGAVLIGLRDELPQALDLRFYNMRPFLERFPGKDDLLQELVDIVRLFADDRGGASFEAFGTSIGVFNELLVVHQSDRIHTRIQRLLEWLLDDGRSPLADVPDWRRELGQRLDTVVSVAFDAVALSEGAQYLSSAAGLPIVVRDDYASEPLTLRLTDTRVADVVGLMSELLHVPVSIAHGALVIGEAEAGDELVLAIHDVSDLMDLSEDAVDRVIDMLRNFVDPSSWEVDPRCSIVVWQGRLIVRQSAAAQARITTLLQSVRQALEPR